VPLLKHVFLLNHPASTVLGWKTYASAHWSNSIYMQVSSIFIL
jgi:hypothetical protein